MVKRLGWVSNSSSSSFICQSCETLEEYDENERYCEHGHSICTDCITKDYFDLTMQEKREMVDGKESDKYETAKKLFNKSYWDLTKEERVVAENGVGKGFEDRPDSYYEELVDEDYIRELDEVPAQICPVCNLEAVSTERVLAYILSSSESTVTLIEAEIREKFKDLKELEMFLKGE